MLFSKDNPPRNSLSLGLSEKDVSEAINESGYPLQTVIANELRRKEFEVQEEWRFVDKELNKDRNIDLLAQKMLVDINKSQPHVTPFLDLLIECKKSELPYLFFLTDGDYDMHGLPFCTGLRKDAIDIHIKDGSMFSLPAAECLSLHNLAFLRKKEIATSFTKCVRDSRLKVKGDEPFNEIVMPMTKAADYFRKITSPKKHYSFFSLHLVLSVAVIDGPMLAVKVSSKGTELELMPWVRVIRHISTEDAFLYGPNQLFMIDTVHKDYLTTYLAKHVSPFALWFAKRVMNHQKELRYCRGYTPDLYESMESSLKPTVKRDI